MPDRPFDHFRTAITDPVYFFGRSHFIRKIISNPFLVHILLGGRRIGKTSVLSAVERSCLNPDLHASRRAFPVFLSLDVEQPESLNHFRYLLIRRLRDAIERWEKVPKSTIREMYETFGRRVAIREVSLASLIKINLQHQKNPDDDRLMGHDEFREALLNTISELRDKGFEGVIFLLDEAEFVVRKDWANEAWSYFRGLKDNDTALKPFLGFILSGYRDVKEYEQRVGSPLMNIAEIEWLPTLSASDAQALIAQRAEDEGMQLTPDDMALVLALAGHHPYLLQQVLNVIFDEYVAESASSHDRLLRKLLRMPELDRTFSSWWNLDGKTDGFGEIERTLYKLLAQHGEGSDDALSELSGFNWPKTIDALGVLIGTGVIEQVDEEHYMIGTRLFQEWVANQEPIQDI
ncbi:MAG: hypothetical protein ETSY2_04255 [Candidatus Entotheonella gemina]|uniref:ATPase domain-containing protein n=1 Tax=Candidatus Entotheonella gemina TaxID=1429439 RepID=W4MFC1_9BACT|nr:MAG: hypothetical protein ETSY2_04255 [Candidatus Entotheonella gemina]